MPALDTYFEEYEHQREIKKREQQQREEQFARKPRTPRKETVLTEEERALVEQLKDPVCTVDFIEEWACKDIDTNTNIDDAVKIAVAKSFHVAVCRFLTLRKSKTE